MVKVLRQPCECQSVQHDLVSNCLKCGRVVCEKEGAGPCFFCDALVLSVGSKNGTKYMKKFTELEKLKFNSSNLMEAERQKEILLSFDKTNTKRTCVIDDQSDYYNTNVHSWLSKDARDALIQQEEKLREASTYYTLNKTQKTPYDAKPTVETKLNLKKQEPQNGVFQPTFTNFVGKLKVPTSENMFKNSFVIQDFRFYENMDKKIYISVLQPFASRIISGKLGMLSIAEITSHRGKLWIVSQNKMIDKDNAENFPLGVLLGCTNVIDCCTIQSLNTENHQQYGPLDNKYVMVFDDTKRLKTPIPLVSGESFGTLKDYIHKAAMKMLLHD